MVEIIASFKLYFDTEFRGIVWDPVESVNLSTWHPASHR